MAFSGGDVLALAVGASFAAGLNVYATVATLGVLSRLDVLNLPQQLSTVESWWVIGICAALYGLEFVADKIPAFDMLWNAMQTFVRVPVAAVLSYYATAGIGPEGQVAGAVLGGGVALASHAGKMAVRATVTPSPEPFSNVALSLVEDVFAIWLTWFATTHPYLAAAIAIALVVLIIFTVRWVIRAMKRLFRGAERQWKQMEAA